MHVCIATYIYECIDICVNLDFGFLRVRVGMEGLKLSSCYVLSDIEFCI